MSLAARPTPRACVLWLAGLLCACAAVGAAEPEWWNQAWRFRLAVIAPPPEGRAGINTARFDMADQSALCRPDGGDVRVLDERARPAPCKVTIEPDGALSVRFRLADDARAYHIYYGNPGAPVLQDAWEEKLGGLTIETRLMAEGDVCLSPEQIPAWLARYTQALDRQPWGQILDLQNPFGRDDFYVSIYEGAIYCPQDGEYLFALNADDIASFYIQDLQSPLCMRRAGVPSVSWEECYKQAGAGRTLARGVYRILYHHIENSGAQLAALGWKPPGADEWQTVPPPAFVRYVPAEVVGREERGAALNPFFVSRHLYDLAVEPAGLRFPHHRFEARCTPREGLQCEWDFGDGSTGRGDALDHEFPETKPYEVTLTVRNAQGASARVTRPVAHSAAAAKRMTVQMQMEGNATILAPADEAAVDVMVRVDGPLTRAMTLERRVLGGGESAAQTAGQVQFVTSEGWGAALHQYLDKLRVQGEQARGAIGLDGALLIGARAGEAPAVLAVDGVSYARLGAWARVGRERSLPGRSERVAWRLLLHGRPVAEKRCSVLSTDAQLGRLTLDAAHSLRDEDGGLVVLRLADVRRGAARPRVLCDRLGRVRVLALDEGLAGPARASDPASYPALLARALGESYRELRFEVDRPDIALKREGTPLRELLQVLDTVAARPDANLVLLVCKPEAPLDGVPLEQFETFLVAALDQILSQTTAEPVLVAPPPSPARPELYSAYARIAKKTGLRKGVVVVDLYSRFMLTPDWPGLFLAPIEKLHSAPQPSYLLHPNEQGQELICREVFTSIVDAMHRDLSRAAQAVSYAREREGRR